MPQIFCRIAMLLIAATPAWAQVNSGSAGNVFAQCGDIADPAARLACYDAAQPPHAAGAAPAKKSQGPSRFPEFNSPSQAQAPATAFDGSRRGAPAANGKLIAGVVSYSLSPNGRFTIVLDNGQVWRQVDSDDGVAQFRKQGRNTVAISKGFLWSYDLKLNAMSAVFKVTRVK